MDIHRARVYIGGTLERLSSSAKLVIEIGVRPLLGRLPTARAAAVGVGREEEEVEPGDGD